jgi:hypothetical protein
VVAGNINADVTLRNNTVGPISDDDDFPFGGAPGTAETHATRVESRNDSNLCLDIANNSSDGLVSNQDYLVRQRDTSTFRLERLGANTNVVATVESCIAGQNPLARRSDRQGDGCDHLHHRGRRHLQQPDSSLATERGPSSRLRRGGDGTADGRDPRRTSRS